MLDNNVLVILDISKITLLDAQKICRFDYLSLLLAQAWLILDTLDAFVLTV